ncbi:acyl-CoA dehydrogenase family protein [Acidobacteriota bacterium]
MNNSSYQQQIIDEARFFAENEIKPRAREFDENGILHRDLLVKLAGKKFLAASFPEKFGGLRLDPVYYGRFTEEIGKACCSTRALITVHTSLVGETLLKWGNDEQKHKWLPLMSSGKKIGAFALSEPDVGTDAKGIKTQYRKSGDKYVINGQKKWVSFGDIADFFIVFASDFKRITAFLVERKSKGVESKPIKGMLANRAAHIAEIELKDVFVPEENVIGRVGCGFPLVIGTALDHGRYSIAWAGVGIAQAALEEMVNYARTRCQFGRKISNFQLIRGLIGNAVTKVHASRALCLRAGEMRKIGDPDAIIETTIAKYFSSKMALEVAADAVQVHGGSGCYSGFPVERFFREAKLLEIVEGTSQIHQEILANYALRKYYKGE